MKIRVPAIGLVVVSLLACGGAPSPKIEEPAVQETRTQTSGPTAQISQELGSIDERRVEQTFANLVTGPLESCHKQGRERLEFLTGDVKAFLRIDGKGKMRYGFLEESTLGDRETEKCVLAVFSSASWPKPEGGEAEVRSGFGWGGAGEREPTTWSSDKVTAALLEAKDVRKNVEQCRAGVKGEITVTAYVEADESAASDKPAPNTKRPPKVKPTPKHSKKGNKEMGGKFKAIGVSTKSKDLAEKIDCIVDALKALELPSPGSYPAKVTFSL